MTCAGVTTHKAVKVAGTRPSDLVAVFGVVIPRAVEESPKQVAVD